MGKRIGTDQVMNYSNYSNERVDELLAQGRALVTEEDRGACYKEIQAILAEDLPIIRSSSSPATTPAMPRSTATPYIDQIADVHDGCYAKAEILE